MSTVKTNAILDASGGNTATINSMTPTADSLQGFRNRLINSDMRIDQRNAGASVTPTSGQYTLDRWGSYVSQTSKLTVQRSTTAPVNFINSLLVTSSSSYSVLTGDFFTAHQFIEGFNVSDLAWGTANAKTVTLSFWVRSSLTGTFGGTLGNSAGTRSYPFTYTISSANTFEQKTITITGDTSGTWLTDNGIGLRVYFGLGVGATYSGTAGAWATGNLVSATGAVSVVGTNGATWYITGVQLEVGSVATPFERRDYGRELMMCQRYFYKTSGSDVYSVLSAAGSASNTTNVVASVPTKVTMRSAPSFSSTGNLCVSSNNLNNIIAVTSIGTGSRNTAEIPLVSADVASGLTASVFYVIYANNSSTASLLLSSEL